MPDSALHGAPLPHGAAVACAHQASELRTLAMAFLHIVILAVSFWSAIVKQGLAGAKTLPAFSRTERNAPRGQADGCNSRCACQGSRR